MKRILLLLILCVIGLSTNDLNAQRKKKKKPITEKSEVIVFDDEEVEPSKSNNGMPLIIKTNPFSFIFGKQLLEGELEIADFVSIQAGLGLTFKNQLEGSEFYSEIEGDENLYFENSPNWQLDITDYYGNESREQKLGFMFSLSPRFFYASDGFEGGYIAPSLTYTRNNYYALGILPNGQPSNIFSDSENISNLDFTVRYGYNILYDNLMTESFFGIGIRNSNANRQDIGIENGNYGVKTAEIKTSGLRLEMGIRIGFQL